MLVRIIFWSMWCIFFCHTHLMASFVAQQFGHRHGGWNVKPVLSLSCIFRSCRVIDRFLLFLVFLVGAVSRYCHFWYR